jgi:hypothetical protein
MSVTVKQSHCELDLLEVDAIISTDLGFLLGQSPSSGNGLITFGLC